MAESVSVPFHEEFCCAICLDLLKDPVTVPCGHSFCMGCVTGCWDREGDTAVYRCPQCRQAFTPRPVLGRNTMMADMLEKLKMTRLQSDAETPCFAGPADVECDLCSGRKRKAVKSCLTCVGSFCQAHVQPHIQHELVKASHNLQEKMCPQHRRILEVFCHTDETLICMMCLLKDHSGHKTASAADECLRKQAILLEVKGNIPVQRQHKTQEVGKVRQVQESLQASVQEAVDESERIFTELMSFLEQIRSEVAEALRAQEGAELSRAEGLLKQLGMEDCALTDRDCLIDELLEIKDPAEFLLRFQFHFRSSSPALRFPKVSLEPNFSFRNIMQSVSPSLKEKTVEFHKEIFKVTGFMDGDRVKLKTPKTITRSITCEGCNFCYPRERIHKYDIPLGDGVVKGATEMNKTSVCFPEQPHWRGSPSKLQLMLEIQ